jgi:hypothetical protein
VSVRLDAACLPSAADVLGAEHPVARAAELRRVVARQLTTASAMLAVAVTGVDLDGARLLGTFLAAAAAVEVCLVIAALAARASVRERARDLIAEGGDVAVAEVAAECRRLVDGRHRARLAVTLGRALAGADQWHALPLATRPPPSVLDLAPHRATIADVIALLRAPDTASARGVALLDRLLRGGYAAPLYVARQEEVGRELVRIRLLLTAAAGRAGPAN